MCVCERQTDYEQKTHKGRRTSLNVLREEKDSEHLQRLSNLIYFAHDLKYTVAAAS